MKYGLSRLPNRTAARRRISLAIEWLEDRQVPAVFPGEVISLSAEAKGNAIADFNKDGINDLAVANGSGISVFRGNGDGRFGAETYYDMGGFTRYLALGDINRDGNIDIVNGGRVLLGNGAGGFSQGTIFSSGGFNANGVALGDLNGDGKLDVAVANGNGLTIGAANVGVLLGDGAGGFGPVTAYPTGAGSTNVAIADLNGDGKPDLAVTNGIADTVSVLFGSGNGSFGAATNYAAMVGPDSVVVNDLNSDGRPDLLVANRNSSTVSVFLGTGGGRFGAQTAYAAGGSGAQSLIMPDVNRDGKPDMVTANISTSSVSVRFADGSGGFAAPKIYAVGTSPQFVSVGDLNNDGSPDLVCSNYDTKNVSVLLNRGTGDFVAPTVLPPLPTRSLGRGPSSLAAGDFNGDGKLDLVNANEGTKNFALQLGDGVGGFAAPTLVALGATPGAMAVGDYNRDGRDDLAITISTNVRIFLSNGAGGFGAGTNFPTGGTGSGFVTAADFNEDGKLDLVIGNNSSNNVSVLLGNGTGGFAAASTFPVGSGPGTVVVADFNLDGHADLAVTNNGSRTVSILLGNGQASFSSATNFTVGNTPTAMVAGDVNRDGKLDLAVVNALGDNVSVLVGNGAGGFSLAATLPVGSNPLAIAIGDYDGNGTLDLAVVNQYAITTMSLLLGLGNGTFSPAIEHAVGRSPRSIVGGDFNRDGRPDLVVGNFNEDNLTLFLNTSVRVIADGAAVSASEGSPVTNSGRYSAAQNNNTVTLTATVDGAPFGTIIKNANGTWTWSANTNDGPLGPKTVTVTAKDSWDGQIAITTFTYQVQNVAPTAILSTNSGVLFTGEAKAFFSNAFDPSIPDTSAGFHYVFSLDVDTTSSATYANTKPISSVNFGKISPGAHTVYARIIDKDGGSSFFTTTLLVYPILINPRRRV